MKAKERGNAFFMQSDFPAAVREYDEAIRRDPSNASFYCNRATALSKLMDYGRALDDIKKALELDPAYVKAYYRRGLIEMALKKYHRCLQSFQRGLEISPEDAGCLEGLRKTQQKIAEVGVRARYQLDAIAARR